MVNFCSGVIRGTVHNDEKSYNLDPSWIINNEGFNKYLNDVNSNEDVLPDSRIYPIAPSYQDLPPPVTSWGATSRSSYYNQDTTINDKDNVEDFSPSYQSLPPPVASWDSTSYSNQDTIINDEDDIVDSG